MPKIAFVSTAEAANLRSCFVKRVYVVAPVKTIDIAGIESKRCCFLSDPAYYDRAEQVAYYKEIVDFAKTLSPEEVIVFQCLFGRSRSYEAASIVAELLGQDSVFRITTVQGEQIMLTEETDKEIGTALMLKDIRGGL